MKTNLFRLTIFVALGALALNTAMAESTRSNSVNTSSIAVSYADLNMASTEGLDILYRRIKSAAHKVCGVDKMPGRPVDKMRVSQDIVSRNQACVADAIDDAISDINNVKLTYLHQARLAESRQS